MIRMIFILDNDGYLAYTVRHPALDAGSAGDLK